MASGNPFWSNLLMSLLQFRFSRRTTSERPLVIGHVNFQMQSTQSYAVYTVDDRERERASAYMFTLLIGNIALRSSMAETPIYEVIMLQLARCNVATDACFTTLKCLVREIKI